MWVVQTLVPLALLLAPPRAPPRSAAICMKTAAPKGKGFGAATKTKASKKKVAPIKLDPTLEAALAELAADGVPCLERYLNPKLFEDEATMRDIGEQLRAGEVVVLRDAFRPEFAEMVHAELSAKSAAWELNEAYFPDGYHHRHHNIYDRGSWSARLNMTQDVFTDESSQQFISKLTARDCSGEVTGAPSWYQSGDHSLPHTDWVAQRTVAYVWHLSKNWKPEWGGALYWAQNDHAVATYPASFNTLVLFSVTTKSAHFVTTVSPHHKGQRLTFNGWWNAAWTPSVQDDLEGALSDPIRRQAITHTQLQAMTDLLNDRFTNIDDERREHLQGLRKKLIAEFFPEGTRVGLTADAA